MGCGLLRPYGMIAPPLRAGNSVMRELCLWLLLLLTIPAVAQEKSKAQFETYVSGTIDVAKDGAVSGYTLDDKVKPAIRAAIDKNVRAWHFEPITVDGQAVAATTQMNLQLLALPLENGDYGLRVEKAWFGDPQRSNHMPAPAYPVDAARAGRQAKVVLVLRLDPQGNVVEAFPEQTSLDITPDGKKAEYWRKRFQEASIRAAKEWKFTITEKIDGHPIGGSVRIPISYALGQQGWGKYVPGPINPIPWKSDAKVAETDISSLQDGQAQSIDSRFKLKTGIVGSML